MKIENSSVLAGLLTAIASSLCCITPVVAFFAGTGSLASSLSWIEPARPYLLGATALALGFAWYQKIKPAPVDDCGCTTPAKRSFMQSTSFLVGMTLFAIAASAFPLYANLLYPKSNTFVAQPKEQDHLKAVTFNIEGMTCAGCEGHVRTKLEELPGIFDIKVSYADGNASVRYEESLVSTDAIQQAIEATGYSAVQQKPE